MAHETEGGGASRSTDPAAGTFSATDVSLREYFNEKIGSDRRLNNERFAFAAVIGAVVWFFVERHLTDLNHENARVAKIAEGTVSADTYESDESRRTDERNKLDSWRAHVDEGFTKSATKEEVTQATKIETRAVAASGWQWALGIAAVLATLLAFYGAIRATTSGTRPVIVEPIVTTTTR